MLRSPSLFIFSVLVLIGFLGLRAAGVEGWDFGRAFRLPIDASPDRSRSDEPVSGRAFVVDGDTLDVRGQRIRVWGIDAPEGRQLCARSDGQGYPCGREAARALAAHLRRADVRCVPRDRDRYGRMVGQCFVGEEDVGRWLVQEGWAMAWPRLAGHSYAADQRAAEQARRGLWQGRFRAPSEWRRTELRQ